MTEETKATSQVAFIGLGRMGGPMARRLLGAGYQLSGYDLSPAAAAALAEGNGRAAASAADAVAGSDVAILMLPDSRVVRQVLTNPAVRAALSPGSTVVDMSSSDPEVTRSIARDLRGQSVALVDAPVSGGVRRAETGELAIMVGGEPEDIGRVRPLLDVLGRSFLAGPVGAGHAVKALNNLMSATHLLITSEAIAAGQRFGLDTQAMLAIFNASSGRSGSTENKWPNFIMPATFDSGFSLQLMLKDMRIATALAKQMSSPSELGQRAVQLWAEAAGDLPADADHTEIASWISRGAQEET